MSYIISEDGKELLKDVRDFCVNEVKEQVKEYDISGDTIGIDKIFHYIDVVRHKIIDVKIFSGSGA